MQINLVDMGIVAQAGFTLIPLHRHDAQIPDKKGKLKPAGKRPQHLNWTKQVYNSAAVLEGAAKSGWNLGVRLTGHDLVVDVDPRHFPDGETMDTDNPLRQLEAACGFSYADYPHTVTGSGGLHIWMKKDPGLSVRDSLPEYPGVEYKTLGRQVVAPGSIHPDTGKLYVLIQPFLAELDATPMVTTELSVLIGHKKAKVNRTESLRRALDGPVEHIRTTLDARQVSEVLPLINIPAGEGLYADWVKLLMAASFASGGCIDVMAELEAWSDGEANVGDKWQSFGQHDGDPVTFGTFAKLALEYCAPENKDAVQQWISDTRAASDFAYIKDEADSIDADMSDVAKDDDPENLTELTTDSPMELAQAFSKRHPVHVRFDKSWLRYEASRGCYIELENEDEKVKAPLWEWLKNRPYKAGGETKYLRESITLVSNVVQALCAQSQLPSGAKLPTWRAKDLSRLPDPKDLIPLRNGLFHIPSRRLLPSTPMFISVRTADVPYVPDATCPDFEAWITQIFTPEDGPSAGYTDHACIQAVQEFMGYCLTTDTSIHKMLYILGPSRSGKGTLLKVIESLIGEQNVESPNADDMGGQFALEPLVKAQVTMFTDIRSPGAKTMHKLLGQLLRLVGGDRTQVNMKFKKARSERIFTKFIIAANDLLSFHDNSDAIFNRMLIVQTPNSYFGREDPTLDKKLKAEISGILNWALQGLYRLQDRGRFIEPKSTRHILGLMKTSASPVGAFIDARVRYNPQSTIPKDFLYETFREWAVERDLYDPGKDTFFKYFYANKSSAGEARIADAHKDRVYCVTGVELLPDL